jgi:hypothetical protein
MGIQVDSQQALPWLRSFLNTLTTTRFGALSSHVVVSATSNGSPI